MYGVNSNTLFVRHDPILLGPILQQWKHGAKCFIYIPSHLILIISKMDTIIVIFGKFLKKIKIYEVHSWKNYYKVRTCLKHHSAPSVTCPQGHFMPSPGHNPSGDDHSLSTTKDPFAKFKKCGYLLSSYYEPGAIPISFLTLILSE